MVYLDNAATTFPKPESVYERMDYVNRNMTVNAGRGSYDMAEQANGIIIHCRELMKELFHADDRYETILTSSATLAINQILYGIRWEQGDIVYITPYEHNSVVRTLHAIENNFGIVVKQMKLTDEYMIDLDDFRYQCAVDEPRFVVMTAVSNVTGYCLPIGKIAEITLDNDIRLVVDASQAAGLLDMNIVQLGVDCIVFAGHKTLYGPFGVGGFVGKIDFIETLETIHTGGTGTDSLNLAMPDSLPERMEAGSQNILAVAGLEAALIEMKGTDGFEKSISDKLCRERELGDYLYQRLAEVEHVEMMPIISNREDCIGIVSFCVDGYDAEDVGDILNEEYDIAVRTGYHCAPHIHKHLGSVEKKGVVRASLGRFNTKADVDKLVEALQEIR